jgi:serine/threonine protein kinase
MKFKKDEYEIDTDNDDIKGTKLIVNPDNDDDDEEEEKDEDEEEKDDMNNNKIMDYFNSDKKIKKNKKKPQRNKTFVGTAEYVSPEVISDTPAGYGADLWAFGVILYQMYCGQTPFKSKTNFLTFKNIGNLQVTYPNNINVPKNAKDLINKILIKDPDKRLGAGEPNTDLDIAHLKKHPFFKGIKWKNIINQNVPNAKNLKFKTNKKIVKNIKKEDNKIEIEEKKGEIIKTGVLLKKSFWFIYNEIFVTLYSTPKIEYRNIDKNEIAGVIHLNKNCRVYASKSDIFNLDTPKGKYKFKSKSNDLIIWINAIKDSIKKYGKDV